MASHISNSEIRVPVVKRPASAFIGTFTDAVIVLALLAATLLSLYLPVIDHSIVRFGLAVVLFLFLPGYAAVAAVYPGKGPLGALERTALSVCMSLVISPLIGFWLNFTIFGVREIPMAVGITLFTLACLAVAMLRRMLMPAKDRFLLDLATPASAIWAELSPRGKTGMEKTSTIMLLVAIALVIVTAAFVASVPAKGQPYTELYLYGHNSTIAEYPLSYTLGETKPVIVGIANHEGSAMAYDLAVTIDGLGGARHQLYSERIVLADNETLEKAINLTPDRAGDHLNMQFLLYVDGVTDAPYRACNLWVDVKAPANATLPADGSALL